METGLLLERLFLETDMYIKLQSVLEDERGAVIARDYTSLYEVLRAKDRMLAEISLAAQKRSSEVNSMLESSGAKGDKGLGALTMLCVGADKSALKKAGESLRKAMERVNEMNKSNALLVGASLVNIGRSLDFIEAFFMRGTYKPTGLVGGKAVKGVRLRKGV